MFHSKADLEKPYLPSASAWGPSLLGADSRLLFLKAGLLEEVGYMLYSNTGSLRGLSHCDQLQVIWRGELYLKLCVC